MKSSIVIIEDNVFLNELFEMAFLQAGFTVHSHQLGVEGQASALDTKPDFILLDIMMPDLDGLQILQTIRPELPDTKIIICSNLNQTPYIKKAKHLGADLVIDKSLHTPNEIVGLVKKI